MSVTHLKITILQLPIIVVVTKDSYKTLLHWSVRIIAMIVLQHMENVMMVIYLLVMDVINFVMFKMDIIVLLIIHLLEFQGDHIVFSNRILQSNIFMLKDKSIQINLKWLFLWLQLNRAWMQIALPIISKLHCQ